MIVVVTLIAIFVLIDLFSPDSILRDAFASGPVKQERGDQFMRLFFGGGSPR